MPEPTKPKFKASAPYAGVWSPGQARKIQRRFSDVDENQRIVRETPVINTASNVWSPRSAPSSPTSGRKTYKSVKFESPVVVRKTVTSKIRDPPFGKTEVKFSDTNFKRSGDDNPSVGNARKIDNGISNTIYNGHDGYASEPDRKGNRELDRLTTTISNNAGLINTTANKLPRVQNPTITLLQKAREGQLPRGAAYLEQYKSEIETNVTRNLRPNETTIPTSTTRLQYENENSKKTKKMTQESGRKSDGIGPTTKEGIPTALRSDLRDEDHSQWYKNVYDTLHKVHDDRDYVTVRYKNKPRAYAYNGSGYQSEPEPFSGYHSDYDASQNSLQIDRKRSSKNKENSYGFSTSKKPGVTYHNQPGRIEDYEPGHSSISDREIRHNLSNGESPYYSSRKPFANLRGSGYESDSTLIFKRHEDNQQPISPAEQRSLYKSIQKGGEVPLHGLRKAAPEKPKEPVTRSYDLFHPFYNDGDTTYNDPWYDNFESPHKYAESEVTLQYKVPVRNEIKEAWSEDELNRRQVETMRRIYQEERRRKYLQELQDMSNRRHTDNFTPSQKSPISLNRYDDVLSRSAAQRSRSRTPEQTLIARAVYNFTGQTSKELTFRKGDIIFVRRQIDKNWYEGENNATIGLFPVNYVEIIPYDEIRTLPRRSNEGQARAKYNFAAQSKFELSLIKDELITLIRRVDNNWYEGKIGNRRGIFPISYVNVIREPGLPDSDPSNKPIASPAAHSLITSQHHIPSQHCYQPNSYGTPVTLPRNTNRILSREPTLPYNENLLVDTSSEPIPYRALYNYRPQNEDELELQEGDTVYVMEKCDDGWYVGSSQRTSYFGTFPGNYVERIS